MTTRWQTLNDLLQGTLDLEPFLKQSIQKCHMVQLLETRSQWIKIFRLCPPMLPKIIASALTARTLFSPLKRLTLSMVTACKRMWTMNKICSKCQVHKVMNPKRLWMPRVRGLTLIHQVQIRVRQLWQWKQSMYRSIDRPLKHVMRVEARLYKE